MNLSPVQEEIVHTPGNLIVKASAGTGKTQTMVRKIVEEINSNHTHKVIAAITFTIKAAQEIKDRLSVDIIQHFIGTNNSFAIAMMFIRIFSLFSKVTNNSAISFAFKLIGPIDFPLTLFVFAP